MQLLYISVGKCCAKAPYNLLIKNIKQYSEHQIGFGDFLKVKLHRRENSMNPALHNIFTRFVKHYAIIQNTRKGILEDIIKIINSSSYIDSSNIMTSFLLVSPPGSPHSLHCESLLGPVKIQQDPSTFFMQEISTFLLRGNMHLFKPFK